MNLRTVTILVLIFSLLSACATSTYRSPGTEADALSGLAVLEYNGDLAGVNIVEVDGKGRGIGFFRRYELAPGERSLKIELNVGFTHADPVVLSFVAVAGETYELKYEVHPTDRKGGTWGVWVENKQTRKLVASKQGQPGA
jgi:hypothetical protein